VCAAALAGTQQLRELRDIVKGQPHFLVLPAFEPEPIRERFQEGMSNAAKNVMIWQQQKVAWFAAGSNKETLQVCCSMAGLGCVCGAVLQHAYGVHPLQVFWCLEV
jgi:hypothetical protein